jgi:hypothetical protein
MAAASMMPKEYHPKAVKWSRNKMIPSNAVATSSKFSQRETDAAEANLNPKRNKIGPSNPPNTTDPSKKSLEFLSIFHGRENAFCIKINGKTPNEAPMYKNPASWYVPKASRRNLLAGVAAPKRIAAIKASIKGILGI